MHFESELLKELNNIASRFESVVASRNKLKFGYNKKYVAETFFDHIACIDSYVLCGMVYGGEIQECALIFEPPYKSNLFNKGCFSFVSSGEQSKLFSGDFGGAIKTPTPGMVGEVCAHIRSVLEDSIFRKFLLALNLKSGR